MKHFNLLLFCTLFCLYLSSCDEEPGKIQVQNNLPEAILKNIEWGEVALS